MKKRLFKIAAAVFMAAICASCAHGTVDDMQENDVRENIVNADEPRADRVDELLNDMTLEEKIYQMFIIRPESIVDAGTVIQAGDATKAALKEYPVGGIIYGADNLIDTEQTKTMIENVKSYSQIAPFISVDEEGGLVARVAQKLGTTKFEPMYTYKDGGAQTANEIYTTIAKDIKPLGFNLDFAPVADVWTNRDNQVIGTRAFSDEPNQAAEMVGTAVKGLQDNGVCAAIKHFPGHGNTEGDSHMGFVYTSKTLDELRECEFVPFEEGINAGADFVMAGHIIVTEVDDVPATLSHRLITDILKGELGYGGLIITDGMEMGAIADNYTSADAAVMTVQAGCDVILEPSNFTESADALIAAVRNGTITEERINESVRKILECKIKRGIIE